MLAVIKIVKMDKWQSDVNIFSLLLINLAVSHLCAKAVGRINCSYSFTYVQPDLTCMRLKMRLKTCGIAELLPAQDTHLFLIENLVLACTVMNAHVGAHVAAAVEQSQADGARERFDAGVHELVLLQTGGALKRFAAHVTRERPVRRVDGHV